MTKSEGKQFIQDCLRKCGSKESVDNYFVYKYGNRSNVESYQHDEIPTALTREDLKSNMLFVVKCFIHFNVYVVWRLADGVRNEKLIINKTHLTDLLNSKNYNPHIISEVSLGEMGKAWLFYRDELACKSFINQYILNKSHAKEAANNV